MKINIKTDKDVMFCDEVGYIRKEAFSGFVPYLMKKYHLNKDSKILMNQFEQLFNEMILDLNFKFYSVEEAIEMMRSTDEYLCPYSCIPVFFIGCVDDSEIALLKVHQQLLDEVEGSRESLHIINRFF